MKQLLLVDVHAHLDHHYYDGKLDEIIERARKAGVARIITAGVNPPTNRNALFLAKKYPDIVRAALGAYPIDALNIEIPELNEIGLDKTKNFDLDEELLFIKKNAKKIAAISEVGLDFKQLKEYELQQRKNFAKILELAKEIEKPLIIHSRNAEKETIEMLEEHKSKNVVLHCFSGNKKLVKKAIANGYCLSIPAIVKRLQHFEMVIKETPLAQLLTETDSPWLGPEREKMNEPANTIESIKKISIIKGLTEEEAAKQIFMNYQKLFE